MSSSNLSRDNTNKLSIGKGYLLQDRDGEGLMRDTAQVVIVGAGLAGLAAAQRLHANGVGDVIVMDAQDRVGGRVHTIKHSDYLVELGAQWLHGANDNPLHQWLAGLKMLDDFEDGSSGFKGTFCTSQPGDNNIDIHLIERTLSILNESKSNLFNDNIINSSNNINSIRASEVFRDHLDREIARDLELLANRQLVQAIYEWFLRYEQIENCCDHMDEVSVHSYTDWSDLGEGTLLNFKDGYQSLLAWFCDNIPRKQWLHLSKQVLNIELLSENDSSSCSPVLIKFKDLSWTNETKLITKNHNRDNDGEYKILECQHVIVTASLGFLKQNSKSFFTPPLPSAKQTLIDSIGFGTVNKIVLQFDKPFWSTASGRSGGSLKLLWRDEDFCAPNGHDSFPLWARDILAFDVVRRQPNLLIGWIGGQGAKIMELETDEQVAKVCARILDKFLPHAHKRPSRLVACLCSRWHTNPFTCGSYSFQSMNSFQLNVDKLAEPIYNKPNLQGSMGDDKNHLDEKHKDYNNNNNRLRSNSHINSITLRRVPRIMFAGEATAGKLYSTTHGAVISGWREADRLLDHLAAANQQANTLTRASSSLNFSRT